MHITELLDEATRKLGQAGIESPQVDARLLLQYITGLSRTGLYLQGAKPVEPVEVDAFFALVRQRCRRTPLQHLLGLCEFWSMEFIITPDVLIPRPETEYVLERVLSVLGKASQGGHVLDLCTGSGVIAVVLARETGCRVTAIDISLQALVIAQKNIVKHGVAHQVMLAASDLFAGLSPHQQFDCIVSNPPYIAEQEIETLSPEVCRGEPRIALSGGESGTEVIERIAGDVHLYLKPGGWLFLEIGSDQQQAVIDIFCSTGNRYTQVDVHADWAGRPRVLQARKPVPPEQ